MVRGSFLSTEYFVENFVMKKIKFSLTIILCCGKIILLVTTDYNPR